MNNAHGAVLPSKGMMAARQHPSGQMPALGPPCSGPGWRRWTPVTTDATVTPLEALEHLGLAWIALDGFGHYLHPHPHGAVLHEHFSQVQPVLQVHPCGSFSGLLIGTSSFVCGSASVIHRRLHGC